MGVAIAVTGAANNVNLVDIGTDADTDGFVDGIAVAINSTGFKGFFLVMVYLACLVEQPLLLQRLLTKLKL